MREKRKFKVLVCVFIFVLSVSFLDVEAINTGFEVGPLSDKEKNMFITNVDIELIENEPEKESVVCFDVNDSNLIAIGQRTSGRKTICVYSCNGDFQYGYTFNCDGDFGVEWDKDNLNIYFVRSHILVSVATSGKILDALDVQNTIDNNSYVNHFIHATKRTVNGIEYRIGNQKGLFNFLSVAYSQITVKDVSGEEKIIYDVSTTQLLNTVINIGFFIACFIIVVLIVIGDRRKKHTASALCVQTKPKAE